MSINELVTEYAEQYRQFYENEGWNDNSAEENDQAMARIKTAIQDKIEEIQNASYELGFEDEIGI